MFEQSIYQSVQRYRTLKSGKISTMPILILMPHSACNCRCIMCDIWKNNRNHQQLTEKDITALLFTIRKWRARQVVMSGGEALLNPAFFQLCALLKKQRVMITVLSAGLTLNRHAESIVSSTDELIVSLDG